MAILSAGRSRRGRKAEATEQFIAFRLRQEWFALRIDAVHRVVTLGQTFGDPGHTGIGLTQYQDQELLVIDVSQRIFAEEKYESLIKFEAGTNDSAQRCLIVLKNSQGELIGLPIDSQPEVKRAPASRLTPLPATYTSRSKIRCLSSMMVQLPDEPPLFLLDPDQLSAT
ncbi:MAG: chemotaxis protein CheW [Thermosynechococcaceae cyanobacterium]